MLHTAEPKPLPLSETQFVNRTADSLVRRKIWLPKLLYDGLPIFYIVSGFFAFLATLYVSEWFWVLPQYLLFSAACMHMGLLVYRRRRRRRTMSSMGEPPGTDKDGE